MSIVLPPVHPGEVLVEEFTRPLGVSMYRLAKEIGVAESTLSRLARGRSSVTADMALRLARRFSTSPQFWMGLQADHDLDVARDAHGAEIERVVVAG